MEPSNKQLNAIIGEYNATILDLQMRIANLSALAVSVKEKLDAAMAELAGKAARAKKKTQKQVKPAKLNRKPGDV